MADGAAGKTFLQAIVRDEVAADDDIREGRFQRSLALVAGASSLLSGLEVAYEHYRGSYGQRIMYSPVLLSPALAVAGVWGFFSKRAARTVLPAVAGVTLADCLIGFGYHVRGIARKPGGWRVPVANLIMGPPLFAPLLFGIAGYLGLIAAFLRREHAPAGPDVHPAARPVRTWMELSSARDSKRSAADPQTPESSWDDSGQGESGGQSGAGHASWEQDVREGRFQKHLAVATAAASFFSGFESLYSHYKNNFRYRMQWSPIVVSALLTGSALAAVPSRRAARTLLPAASLAAIADGALGFYYHAWGVLRRSGGAKKPLYNIMYGPPIFAPLLFAAAGALGLLASLMRREK